MSDNKCPHCGMLIYDEEALLCHFCGDSLEKSGEGFLGRIRYANNKVFWYFLVFFVIFIFIILTIL